MSLLLLAYGLVPLVVFLCHTAHAAAEPLPYDGRFVAGAVFERDVFHMGIRLSENLNGSAGVSLKPGMGDCYIAAGIAIVWLNVDAVLRGSAAGIVKLAVFDRDIGCVRDGQIVSSVMMEITVRNVYAAAVKSLSVS